MNEGRAIRSAAHHHFDSLGGGGQRHSLLKNRNDPILAAGILLIVVVNIGLGVTDEGRLEVKPLRDHHINLLLIQAKSVLDGVAAGDDGIP